MIQRNKNNVQDLKQRHVLEYKKTSEFLKFALGHRSATNQKAAMANKSIMSASLANASQMHNQSRMSSGPSGIKARQRSLLQSHDSGSVTKLPALAGLSRSAMQGASDLSGQNSLKSRHKSISQSSKNSNAHRLRAVHDQYSSASKKKG